MEERENGNRNIDDLIYGEHENQLAGGEADLYTCFKNCKKDPSHSRFLDLKDLTIDHLPEGYKDTDLLELIRATANVVVRVAVEFVSPERPDFWPGTDKPYPLSDIRNTAVFRTGTGRVRQVNKYTERDGKGTCQCPTCRQSDTPSNVWGEVWIYTAKHVVFDDTEGSRTTCRFFYDTDESPVVNLDGWTVLEENTKTDKCKLKSVTCNVELLDKLCEKLTYWRGLWGEKNDKYRDLRNLHKITIIISHPHGCSKKVSLGRWVERYEVEDRWAKFTYTTCTCPGSSGAFIHLLGCHGWASSCVHIGVNSDNNNFCGPGLE